MRSPNTVIASIGTGGRLRIESAEAESAATVAETVTEVMRAVAPASAAPTSAAPSSTEAATRPRATVEKRSPASVRAVPARTTPAERVDVRPRLPAARCRCCPWPVTRLGRAARNLQTEMHGA